MIFVTLGSQKFQFNRLLEKLDMLVNEELIKEEVYVQLGYSDYIPQHLSYINFLSQDDFKKKMNDCTLLITHGGTGAIISGLKAKKKVIAVPRLMNYGEHVDNHQIQIVEEFQELNYIEACCDIENLGTVIINTKNSNYKEFVSNTSKFLNFLDRYLEGEDYENSSCF